MHSPACGNAGKVKGESLESCCIIVMPDNDIMKSLHERMPAIIASAHHGLWLDPHVADKNKLMR